MSRFLNHLALSIFVSLVVMSCGVENKEQGLSDYNAIKPVFESALSEFNANKLPHERGLFLKGSVDISQEGNKINVTFKESNAESFKVFYLQVKEGRPTIDAFYIEDASILYLRKGLVVHANGNSENYVFSLKDFDVRNNPQVAKLNLTTEYTGYGLGFIDNVDPSLKTVCSCTCESTLVVDPDITCNSGGRGATSCSQGDGTVSCGGGYYACCNC